MAPHDRVQPAAREKLNLVERVQQASARASLPRRIVIVLIAVLFCCPVLAPVAVANKVRTRMATAYVAMVAIWLIYFFGFLGALASMWLAHRLHAAALIALLPLVYLATGLLTVLAVAAIYLARAFAKRPPRLRRPRPSPT